MEPLISVIVSSFNQKSTIEQTIQSILSQETNFSYEVIVHDDCSTDGTSEILKELDNPKLKIILSDYNKYSRGIQPLSMALPYCTGKYIALCEGDDFWHSPNKLEIQSNAMIANPESSISFHPALALYPNGKTEEICKYSDQTKAFSVDAVIRGGGGFMPTPSIMMKKEILEKLPSWFDNAPVGDYYFQIFCSIHGPAIYLPYTLSTYRFFSQSSWTKTNLSIQRKQQLDQFHRHENSLKEIAKEYPYLESELRWAIANEAFNVANNSLNTGDVQIFRDMITTSWLIQESISKKQKLLFKLRALAPFLSFLKRKLLRYKVKL